MHTEVLNQFAGEDALNDALSHLHIRGAVYCRSELRAPWAFSVDKRPTAGFHAISRGKGWLEVEGQDRKIPLSCGDLIVLPRGNAHAMRDAPKTAPIRLDKIIAQNPLEDGIRLRMGGRGPATLLLCGDFQLEGRTIHPLLVNLPDVIHIRGRDGRPAPWVRSTLQQIESETRSIRPGAQTVIARLSDILFVQTVRAYFNESVRGRSSGWIGALKDPQVGTAIAWIHRQPEVSWDVASLAARVGMSRSSFSARFSALVGESPLKYLTKWRVQKAAWLLRTSDGKLSDIANRIGYESEVALSRAFTRFMGVPPGRYRRSHAKDH